MKTKFVSLNEIVLTLTILVQFRFRVYQCGTSLLIPCNRSHIIVPKYCYVGASHFSKLLTDSRRLKRRTSSRQPTPVQGRITASNSNTSRQIVIHIGTLFFQPLFRAGTTFHLALRRLTV